VSPGRVKRLLRVCGQLTGGRAPLAKPNRQCRYESRHRHVCAEPSLGSA
jgi:hypothetical protein